MIKVQIKISQKEDFGIQKKMKAIIFLIKSNNKAIKCLIKRFNLSKNKEISNKPRKGKTLKINQKK